MENIDFEKGKKVIVETAHISTDETPAEEHKIAAEMGAAIATSIEAHGCEVEQWLYIDDIPAHNPKGNKFDIEIYLEFLSEAGYIPTKVFYQEDVAKKAKDILGYLNSKKLTFSSRLGIFLKKDKTHLTSPSWGGPSCPVTDAWLYLAKLEQADYALTILPEYSLGQQKSTKEILKILGVDTGRIRNVYYRRRCVFLYSSNNFSTSRAPIFFFTNPPAPSK